MRRRQVQALSAAVDLLRIPSQARKMRSAPLPPGILLLLRLAAEDGDARLDAEKITTRARESHRDAAIFFIEQILLASSSDAYRVLGLDRTATIAEMRRHMAYLLRWLHPDRNTDPHKGRLARRVLLAWNELRSAPQTQIDKHTARQSRDGRQYHHLLARRRRMPRRKNTQHCEPRASGR